MTKSKAKVGDRLPYLLGKLKAPRVLQRLEQTAERARAEQWPYEQFLETLLEAEVITLDACATNCQARLLDARDLPSVRALNLAGAPRDPEGVGTVTSVEELEAATSPSRLVRHPVSFRAGTALHRRGNSLDDYLLAVDTLTSPVVDCGAVVDAPTLSSHVAQLLGVTRAAAGEMLARIEDEGYVQRGARKGLLLTVDGRAATDRILRKRRILECFAVELLGHELADCYERARELASGFADDDAERMWRSLAQPERCPHGWPIDPEEARREGRALVALSAVESGSDVTIERIEEASTERVGALSGLGLVPGRTLSSVEASASAETVSFVDADGRRSIGTGLASSVLVRACPA
jgi:DtxR family Mn-dependent transcriptional regulator